MNDLGLLDQVPVVSNLKDEWYTPAWIIECARNAFGGEIDLDPASCAEANRTVRARRYITPPDDGLRHEWTGNVWINPPFSAGKTAAFVDKVLVSDCRWIILTMANVSSYWWQKIWNADAAVILLNPRIKAFSPMFRRPDGSLQDATMYLTALFSNLPRADFERGFGHIARIR